MLRNGRIRDTGEIFGILEGGKGVKPMGSNSYLAESELVILVLVLTFVGTILYARRLSRKKNSRHDQ